MDELVVWLRAQLDEDERIARGATPGPWKWTRGDGSPWEPTASGWLDYTGEYLAGDGDGATLFGPGMTPHADAVHIALHDPARVLREIDAKRRIVDTYLAPGEDPHPGLPCINYEGQRPIHYDDHESCWRHLKANEHLVRHDYVLRLLALPYADRPGYREEWRA
ncbi:DUF6221 family protein [Streptomyces longwoodensis]|uniref:DUF6221 family protein n=1 Tax=Streptomyces longwoodensis TaxID=68231 RepID=UPI002DD84D1C|nr:DUF6221 family protein [Streptomyces longwoodensis]WRY87372.1 DUF6221 family protein [Streptomyces longwoodensis]